MPIYEYFCPANNTVYQFYAKSVAQGETIPRCPDNAKFRIQKMVSGFAITKGGASDQPPPDPAAPGPANEEDQRMEAAMAEMEGEFANVDENDPKAMGCMMRRVSEMTGDKLDGEMEEVVRKLEEGADPDSLEEQLGGDMEGMDDPMGGMGGPGSGDGAGPDPPESKYRFKARNSPPRRDPELYDYE